MPYHAGLAADVRRETQRRFVNDEARIIVATVAFGMGIDKPDVRFVYHLDPPKSLEAYYQETGRAGRDGLPATAMMTWGVSDVAQLRQLIASGENDERRRVEQHKLSALLGYCETARCRRQVLLQYFGETLGEPCGNCDTCLEPVLTWDGTIASQKALSAVRRTGERFGQSYLIDLLLGQANERMARAGHDRLPTFGVGADLDRRTWQSVFRQLVAGGFLEVDLDGYGGMRLAGDAAKVLRGERRLELRHDPTPLRGPRRAKGAKAATARPGTRRRSRSVRSAAGQAARARQGERSGALHGVPGSDPDRAGGAEARRQRGARDHPRHRTGQAGALGRGFPARDPRIRHHRHGTGESRMMPGEQRFKLCASGINRPGGGCPRR